MQQSHEQSVLREQTPHPSRSIRLFLVDGTPQGLIVADVGNWSGKVLAAPRGRLPELLKREEAARTGVYVLLGSDPEKANGSLAYIGEADDVAARLRNHLRSEDKDFFDRLATIVSADDQLTKAHVRYLESRLLSLTREAGSVALANGSQPDFQRLPEADKADMNYFVEQLRMVLPILGFDLFRRRRQSPAAKDQSDNDTIFEFATAGASARAQETEEGFVVLAGSTARRATTDTFPAGYLALRDRLLTAGDLVEGNSSDLLGFARDIVFTSPSAAASIVAGRSASGPLEWKVSATGQTYRDWQAESLSAEPPSSA